MIKNKKRKKKKSQREIAQDAAWRACSDYIRHKECMETTGDFEWGICCTCGQRIHYSKLDAGHYISGHGNSIMFVEEGIHIQCRHCNRFREGRKDEYENYMLQRYGKEVCENFKRLKFISTSIDEFRLRWLEKDYKDRLKKLKEEYDK